MSKTKKANYDDDDDDDDDCVFSSFFQNLRHNWILLLLLSISALIALATGEAIFFSLSYLLAGLIIFSFAWAVINVHWLRVRRQVKSNYVQAGQFFEEKLALENTGWLPKLWVEVKDHSNLPNHNPSRVISGLGRKHQRVWQTRTPCFRRGRFRVGPISVLSSDPFGLFVLRQDLPIAFSSTVVVTPLAVDLPSFVPSLGELTGGEMHHRRTRSVTSNVAEIRDYVVGDSLKHIHWRSTARAGRLMVKEFEIDPTADVWLFLDLEQQAQAGTASNQLSDPTLPNVPWEQLPTYELPRSTEEYLVAVTASLAKHFLQQGRSVGLLTYPQSDHRELTQADRGERQLTRIYELLAVLEANGTLPLGELLAIEGMRLNRNTTALVITASADKQWVAGCRLLAGRGVHTTAVIVDPKSFGGYHDSLAVQSELHANHIPYYLINYRDPLAQVLSRPN